MPTFFFGLKTCDSCRAALKSIGSAGVQVDVQDVREGGVPEDMLRRAVDELGADAVVNRRSTTWRGLSETERAGDPVALILAHPALMKRPLIMHEDGRLTVGWNAETRAALGIDG